MKLLNERAQVKLAIKNWLGIYGAEYTYPEDNRGIKVGAELMALDPETATARDVADIIGESFWAHEKPCSECGTRTWNIIKFEEMEGPMDDSTIIFICRDCLVKALRLIEGDSYGETQILPSSTRDQ